MSEELKAFYIAYRDWLDAGAPNYEPFARHDGLCSNIGRLYKVEKPGDTTLRRRLRDELSAQFRAARLDSTFPFGERSYHMRHDKDSQHLHKPRVKWVREHAG